MAAVDTTTAQFTAPAVGATVNIDIANTDWLEVSAVLLIESAGYYDVSSITNATRFVGRNLGYSVNAAATTVIASGVDVNPGNISGTEPMNNYGSHSPTTTKGDLMLDNGTNAPRASVVRQAVGTNGQILVSDSATGTGVDWKTVVPSSASTATDNVIPRFDNTTGAIDVTPVQTSNLVVSDTGAIQSTPSGGDARGTSAVDLQVTRAANTQVASGNKSVICGGENNTASGLASGVACGVGNTASGEESFIGGGDSNVASGLDSSAVGGRNNQSTSTYCSIQGGIDNTASLTYASVSGGKGNTASGTASFVGGGAENQATGTGAAALAGQNNTASAESSVTIGGQYAVANKYGQVAHASGRFAADGDAQTSELVFRNATTDATPTILYLDGGTTPERATIAASTTWTFSGFCTVRHTGTGDSKGWKFDGTLKRDAANNTVLCDAVTPTVIGDDAGAAAWTIAITADDTNEALQIEVTGEAAHSLRWVAYVRIVEVTFA